MSRAMKARHGTWAHHGPRKLDPCRAPAPGQCPALIPDPCRVPPPDPCRVLRPVRCRAPAPDPRLRGVPCRRQSAGQCPALVPAPCRAPLPGHSRPHPPGHSPGRVRCRGPRQVLCLRSMTAGGPGLVPFRRWTAAGGQVLVPFRRWMTAGALVLVPFRGLMTAGEPVLVPFRLVLVSVAQPVLDRAVAPGRCQREAALISGRRLGRCRRRTALCRRTLTPTVLAVAGLTPRDGWRPATTVAGMSSPHGRTNSLSRTLTSGTVSPARACPATGVLVRTGTAVIATNEPE